MKLPNVYANTVKKRPIDMTLSENPLGCSPRALKAARQIITKDIADYPDQTMLIESAASRFSIPTDNLCIGNGSEQLIKLIAQTFLATGDTALVQSGSFSLFTKECMLAGANVTLLDIQNPKKSKSDPKVLFLCNPNNPTGELIPSATIQKILALFPKTLIIIDEANAEFTDVTSIPMAIKNNNVLVLRTCSKALGLAGLRVGFCIGTKKRIQQLKNILQVFPVSSSAIRIATAALQDMAFIRKTRSFIRQERIAIKKVLENKGCTVSNSVTNTLFISTPNAPQIINRLNALGISVIPNTFFPGLTTLGFRIALRDKKTNRKFINKLDSAIETLVINLLR